MNDKKMQLLHAKQDKEWAKTEEISNKKAWNNYSWGSAEIASSSWDRIFDAYNESKQR